MSKKKLRIYEKDQVLLEQFLKKFLPQTSLSFQDLEKILVLSTSSLHIPCSLFKNPLGISQTLVKYLKEEKEFTFATIARLLHKDQRTVWSLYHQALKKFPQRFTIPSQDILIPLDIFQDEKYSDLEHVILFLKDHYQFTYAQIADLLSRDLRNIWAMYQKATKKR